MHQRIMEKDYGMRLDGSGEYHHWEMLHDKAIGDLNFDLLQIWQLKLMLRKHPSDEMGGHLKDLIKMVKRNLSILVTEYEAVYGDKPDIVKMRREVEIENNQ